MSPEPILRPGRCLIIGEVALTHDGSLGLAHVFVDAIANGGADAVKFYAARSLLDTPDVRRTLAWFIDSLAERTNVVLLDTGLVLDEHADYAFGRSSRVISAQPWMTPANNLGVQTQIIAGAQAFVGTCGSVAWLAPMLGVNTSAVYVDPKWLHAHLGVMLRACHRAGAGRFAALDLRALDPVARSMASP